MDLLTRLRDAVERILARLGIIDERRVDEGLVDMAKERMADGEDDWIPIQEVRRDLNA